MTFETNLFVFGRQQLADGPVQSLRITSAQRNPSCANHQIGLFGMALVLPVRLGKLFALRPFEYSSCDHRQHRNIALAIPYFCFEPRGIVAI